MARLEIECRYCGKMFHPWTRGAKYCGALCRQRYWHEQERGRRVEDPKFERPCRQCGKPLRTNDSRKVFCDATCNVAFQNAKRETTKFQPRQCPVCGEEFRPMQKRGVGRTYCSVACRSKAAYERNRHQKVARHFDWRKRRKWDGNWWKALQRDNFTCQLCGLKTYPSQWTGKKRLVVHHLDGTGEHREKNHKMDNLRTLCASCHKLFHSSLSLVLVGGQYFVRGKIFEILGLREVKIL